MRAIGFSEYTDRKKLKELYNSDKIIECINNSKFERIYLFTIVNKREMLLVFGNVEEGPLAVNKNDLKKHKDYMKLLFEEV